MKKLDEENRQFKRENRSVKQHLNKNVSRGVSQDLKGSELRVVFAFH